MDKKFRLVLLCLFVAGKSVSATEIDQDSTESAPSYFFYQDQSYPKDCKDVQVQCSSQNITGAHIIQPDGYNEPFWVFCSGEWTIIQRRFEEIITFNRTWDDYRNGFGFVNNDHWMGNDKLAFLTNQKTYELRIEVETKSGLKGFISYQHFIIIDEFNGYRLVSLGQQGGTIGSLITWCARNTILGACSRCIATCADPSGSLDCTNDCTNTPETCVCPVGYLMDGIDCVRQEECGCHKNGYGVLEDSSTMVPADCTERCTCSSGVLTCETMSCHQEATCRLKEGVRDCYCNDGYLGDGRICERDEPFKDCFEIQTSNNTVPDGNYLITPTGWTRGDITVNCNMTIDGGGWTVIQRRNQSSSRRDFNQNWDTYKIGFGDPSGEFWIGNEKLHLLTNQKEYELRIDMVQYGTHRQFYAQYDLFRIDGENNKFKLSGLGSFTSDTGFDAMRNDHNMFFSTHDRDNDRGSGLHCADYWDGGWWYSACGHAYLNYMYYSGYVGGWRTLPGSHHLIYTEMKIRPRATN